MRTHGEQEGSRIMLLDEFVDFRIRAGEASRREIERERGRRSREAAAAGESAARSVRGRARPAGAAARPGSAAPAAELTHAAR
ncbi:hypothetical protein [Leifsonia sp. SIMBA_070]|uniref:hypothetical protein n=1 Tax=Leifsonia sp. SIMBA_070 TaxID=3085810 RepID=UPI003978E8C0